MDQNTALAYLSLATLSLLSSRQPKHSFHETRYPDSFLILIFRSSKMASFARPTYVDEGVQKFGSGIFCSDYRVLKADIHSDSFFEGPNKEVPDGEAYTEAAHQLAATLPAIDESTLVRTSDGVDLIWFTKRGMFSPYGAVSQTFYDLSMAATQLLLRFFSPPAKLVSDKRHRNHLNKEKNKWNAKGCEYGVYVGTSTRLVPCFLD